MSEKKYAIIRVDNRCPQEFEKIDIEYICRNSKCFQWEGCRRRSKKFYGDTKKQLVNKILQVMMRKYIISYLRTTKQDKINPKHFKSAIDYYLETAKEIVEFLGVKE